MALRAPFLLAAFLSSALLFVVEPLVGRLVLPTFGGAPAVWNGTLLFFQVALLLGYFFAHLAATRLSRSASGRLQPILLLLSLGTFPLVRSSAVQGWVQDRAAQGGAGIALLLLALAGLIGLPFVIISMNSSLLQRWYANSDAPDADRPTFLYAAGNVGSMLALLAYPTLIEPRLALGEQASLWRWGLGLLALLVGACALISQRNQRSNALSTPNPLLSHAKGGGSQRLRWLALAAVPSALLMGCTTYLTSNVAPIPLLWVVPLALYLATFILVFARKPLAPTKILGRIYPMVVVPLAIIILLQADKPLELMAALHLAVFFLATWMCHSRLSQEAPEAERLTEYWLYVSLGGALGGVFVAILAPVLFNSLAEYPIALVAAALLRPEIPRAEAAKPGSWIAYWDRTTNDYRYPALVLILSVVVTLIGKPALPPGMGRTFLLMGLPAALAFAAIDRPVRFGLTLGVAFFVPTFFQVASDGAILLTERSFFGVHRVVRNGNFYRLDHGNTMHGLQDKDHPERALMYYYKNGPVGGIMSKYQPQRVALVGLGVGSLAAYGRPLQSLDYYEIDPAVARIASNPKYFTFLRDSRANVKVILGDARLTLSRAEPGYGLIVLDAFSSDSVPVHLLTVEALQMVFSKLSEHGVVAYHISNRYLELEPVLAAAARKLNLSCRSFTDVAMEDEAKAGKRESHWMVFGRKLDDIEPVLTPDWGDVDYRPKLRPWTDDYSNVLGAFNPDQ